MLDITDLYTHLLFTLTTPYDRYLYLIKNSNAKIIIK